MSNFPRSTRNLFARLAFAMTFSALLGPAAALGQTPRCAQLERNLIVEVLKLFNSATGAQSELTSVDHVLEKLPLEMRQRYIFMTDSRSAQQSSAEFPRVILKSPKGELLMSFNTHPKHRGYDQIEVIYWNAADTKFEFLELKYGAGSRQARVEKNPKSCVNCHQSPSRPNWDPYRTWQGQTPFQVDLLVKDSKETDLFLSFIAKAEAGNGRFRHLKPTVSLAQFKTALRTQDTVLGSMDMGFDGFGANLFDDLSRMNSCRINHSISSSPVFPLVGPVFWLIQHCENPQVERAVPKWAQAELNRYFPAGLDGIRADLQIRQSDAVKSRFRRQELFFNQWLKDPAAAAYELGKIEFDNNEISLETLVPMRYVLEPLGVDIKNWSLSIDVESYTFGDRLKPSYREASAFPLLSRDRDEAACQVMVSRSRDAFNQNKDLFYKSLRPLADCPECEGRRKDAEVLAMNLTKTHSRAEIESEAFKIFKAHSCTECHSASSIDGAPVIPFDQPNLMPGFLKGYSGSLQSYPEILWTRINLPESNRRHMPRTGPAVTDVRELGLIKAYLNGVQ